MGKKLKLYAALMGYGAVLGITVAEIWRRKVHHDSYLNYLPPPREREAPPADKERSDGRMRGAANRLWSPVTASANEQLTRLRRIRTGAPRSTAGAPVPPEEPPASAPTTGGLVR
jgi:hypothetical protein